MINEEEAKRKNPPVVELEVLAGEKAEGHIERFLGTAATADENMPADADVEGTVIIKLK